MSDGNGAPYLTLILGGVRAGKSAAALEHVRSADEQGGVLFVATAEGHDDEMRRRIAVHRAERPARWETLEVPHDLANTLDQHLDRHPDRYAGVVIDCLTLWASNLLLSLDQSQDVEAVVAERTATLVEVIRRHAYWVGPEGSRARRWVLVSNEVGLGVVPPTLLGRRFRDALGRVNQLVAAEAGHVVLRVAGIDLCLKSPG